MKRKSTIAKSCLFCAKEYFPRLDSYHTSKYCCVKCRMLYLNRQTHKFDGENNPNWKGLIQIKCQHCNKIMGKIPYYKDKIKYCSMKCRGLAHRGTNSPHWKGGISDEEKSIRISPEYRVWKKSVIRRDGKICQLCGIKTKNIEVHHILSFVKYPDKRLDINNGVVVCKQCHHQKINRNEQEYESFFQDIVSQKCLMGV